MILTPEYTLFLASVFSAGVVTGATVCLIVSSYRRSLRDKIHNNH